MLEAGRPCCIGLWWSISVGHQTVRFVSARTVHGAAVPMMSRKDAFSEEKTVGAGLVPARLKAPECPGREGCGQGQALPLHSFLKNSYQEAGRRCLHWFVSAVFGDLN
jgi:hypothetical protein